MSPRHRRPYRDTAPGLLARYLLLMARTVVRP